MVEHATPSNSLLAYQNVIEYNCENGFKAAPKLGSSEQIVCELDKATGNLFWKGEDSLIECIPLYCNKISNILNSNKNSNLEGDTNPIGSQVLVECYYGYFIQSLNDIKANLECKTTADNVFAEWEPPNIFCQSMLFCILIWKILVWYL